MFKSRFNVFIFSLLAFIINPATAAFDPASEIKLTASDRDINAFGYSISMDDNRLAVGGFFNNNRQGAVYIYDFDGTTWIQTAKLTASDGKRSDQFGVSVSLDGDRLAVGANVTSSLRGSVYVFDLSDDVWEETAKLTASDEADGNQFGWSTSLDGDRLAVGHSEYSAVYVFELEDGNWSKTKLTASDGTANDNFGSNLSLDGNYLAIGAVGANINGNNNQGSVYVFELNDGNWSETAKLTASDGATDDMFGVVSLDGNRLAVGAYGADIGDEGENQGSVYVFELNDGNWNETAKLTAADGKGGDVFGSSISLDDDRLAIGAYKNRTSITTPVVANKVGSVYVFELSNDNWNESVKLTASDDTGAGYQFGFSTALDGEHLATGTWEWGKEGSVYVYAPTTTISTVTGAWYDENYNGMGFNMVESQHGLFVYFYGYKGTGNGEAQWLLTQSLIPTPIKKGKTYTVDMGSGFLGNGGSFTTKPPELNLQRWGTIELTFNGCNDAVATLEGRDGQLTHNLTRIANIPGLNCTEQMD